MAVLLLVRVTVPPSVPQGRSVLMNEIAVHTSLARPGAGWTRRTSRVSDEPILRDVIEVPTKSAVLSTE